MCREWPITITYGIPRKRRPRMAVISNALSFVARVFFKARITAQRMAVPLQDPQDVFRSGPPINMKFPPSLRICRSRVPPSKFVIVCQPGQKVSLCTQTESGMNVSVCTRTVPIFKELNISFTSKGAELCPASFRIKCAPKPLPRDPLSSPSRKSFLGSLQATMPVVRCAALLGP